MIFTRKRGEKEGKKVTRYSKRNVIISKGEEKKKKHDFDGVNQKISLIYMVNKDREKKKNNNNNN